MLDFAKIFIKAVYLADKVLCIIAKSGDGGICTLASVARPTAFRVRTLQPLGYISTTFLIISGDGRKVNPFFIIDGKTIV